MTGYFGNLMVNYLYLYAALRFRAALNLSFAAYILTYYYLRISANYAFYNLVSILLKSVSLKTKMKYRYKIIIYVALLTKIIKMK
jgi:hypothetical protein